MTTKEQIAEFVKNNPGEWREAPSPWSGFVLRLPADYDLILFDAGVPGIGLFKCDHPETSAWVPVPWHRTRQGDTSTLIARIASRVADCMPYSDAFNEGPLPEWLAPSVRNELHRRAIQLSALADIVSGVLTTSSEISPDSQAIEQARAVLKAASSPASLPIWQVRIAIVTDAHGVYVVISHDDQPLFTSRHVAIDRLIEALEDAAQFAEHGMPYDDGGSALMSVRDWIARLSVVPDLRRILGVTV